MTMMMTDQTDLLETRNIALVISYDGSTFSGWQRQNGPSRAVERTVQEEIEKALARMHGHSVPVSGSGRTDAGVHATGQVAHFHTDIASIPADRFVPALNSMLPRDIRILSSREVHRDFHARFSALSRTYRFYIYCGKYPLAHELPYVWHLGHWPDIGRINRMAGYLCGEIDCTTFAAAGDQSASKTRYLFGASFRPEGERLIFEITANAFLWRMVRSITGTLVYLDSIGAPSEEFQARISARERKAAGPTAPGEGLFLWNVRYPEWNS